MTKYDLSVNLVNDPSSASESLIPKDLSITKSTGGDANVLKSADETAATRSSLSRDHQINLGLPEQWRSTASFSSDVYLCEETISYTKLSPNLIPLPIP